MITSFIVYYLGSEARNPSFAFSSGERSHNPDFGKLVDGIRFVDRDGTNGGKCNRVSFGHQAWRDYNHHTMKAEENCQLNFRGGGSVLANEGG
jgi:hypothetical protein